MNADVLVVGGGIGGAVLALILARAGRSVVVLERESGPPRANRPEVLWPATMATFDALGVGEDLRAGAAIPLEGFEVRRGGPGANGRLLRLDTSDFAAAGITPWSTDPGGTRERLMDAAVATGGVELLRGVEAREVRREAGYVAVSGVRGSEPVERRGAVLVGDDGARSRVREAAGIALDTELLPLDFAGAVVRRPAWLPPAEARVWLNPPALFRGIGAVGFMPLPGERAAMFFPISPAVWERLAAAGSDAFRNELGTLAPHTRELARELRFPDQVAHFRRPIGHADRYVADRIALVGDALHPVSPAGGQGANMSVADAAALAQVLLARLPAGDLSAASLAPYEAERRAANERSIDISRAARRAFLTAQRLPLALWLAAPRLRQLDRNSARKRALVHAAATAFVGTCAAAQACSSHLGDR